MKKYFVAYYYFSDGNRKTVIYDGYTLREVLKEVYSRARLWENILENIYLCCEGNGIFKFSFCRSNTTYYHIDIFMQDMDRGFWYQIK